jgi:hypothetical protein
VVIEWSRVESLLNDVLWNILGLSFEDGRVLTGRADAITKIALLQLIAPRHLTGEHLAGLLVLLDTADALREDRNFIVHGSWGTLMPDNLPVAASLRPKSKPDEVMSETFSRERMRGIIKQIIFVRSSLVILLNELETSPGTPGE